MKSIRRDSAARLRLVFITSNGSPWGGSEELWGAAAAALARRGHQVTAYKRHADIANPRILALQASGCNVRNLARLPLLHRKIHSFLSMLFVPMTFVPVLKLWLALACSRKPDLVILSQGGNTDGRLLGRVCRRLKVSYVLIAQKASDLHWPHDHHREQMRNVYRSARWCFFVSAHNRRLTEEQLACALPHSSVVRNPFLVQRQLREDWPEDKTGWRLACVGRLDAKEKGQDLLLRVLAREKWRARPLNVTLYGAGHNRQGLEGMARYLNLERVSFGGFVPDPDRIWDDHHGLILPSRCEGMALVMVEAMMSGRLAILTDVAGAREIVDDDLTGFLAAAPTEDSVDEALERAWRRRSEWRAIGARAAQRIRMLVPPDPAEVFADALEKIASQEDGSPVLSPASYPPGVDGACEATE